jgi:hypothetical protein
MAAAIANIPWFGGGGWKRHTVYTDKPADTLNEKPQTREVHSELLLNYYLQKGRKYETM